MPLILLHLDCVIQTGKTVCVCVFVRVHAFPPGLFWSSWSTVGAAEGSRRPLKETLFGHHQPSVLFFIYERCDVSRTRCCDVIDS